MAIQSLTDLKALINSTIQDNTTNDISGSDVQTALINAIDTLDSLEGFINVHKANGQTTITAYGSKALARAAVPDDCKKEGVVIAYKISTGWLIEQNLDATAGTWGDDASWQTIGPVSVSQNTLIIGGNEVGKLLGCNSYNTVITTGYLSITTDKRFTVDKNLVCRKNGVNYIIPEGSTFTLSNIVYTVTTMWAIIFDTDNLALIAKDWHNLQVDDIVIAFVSTLSADGITSVIHSVVPYKFEGLTEMQRNIKNPLTPVGTQGGINCDNTTKKFSVSKNIVFRHNGVSYTISAGTELGYDWSTSNTTLYKICADVTTNPVTLKLERVSNDSYLPVLFTFYGLGTQTSNNEVIQIVTQVLPITIDGNIFSREQGSKIYSFCQKGQLYKNTPLQINTNSKLISVGTTGNLVFFDTDGVAHALGNNYTYDYSGVTTTTTLYSLRYDYTNLQLKLLPYSLNTDDNTLPMVCKIVMQYGTTNILAVYDNRVPITVDGYYFDTNQIYDIRSIANGSGKRFVYNGEKIHLNAFDVRGFKNSPFNFSAQSMAIYNDYAIFFNNTLQKAYLYNLNDGVLLVTLDIPNGGYHAPHCNTACVGNEFANANSIMPLIYVSQWDADYEKACFVYDVQKNDDVYSLVLSQLISLENISDSIIGTGQCDFAVDNANNLLYAIAYKTPRGDSAHGTATKICSFSLPVLNDSSEVVMSDSDIVDNFELPLIEYRQDCFYLNNKIYLASGGVSSVKSTISVIDVTAHKVVTNVPIYQYRDEEVECIDIYNNTTILFNYGTGLLILDY